MNDLHVGEHCSGTIVTRPDGTSYPPCNSAVDYPDYAYRMDAAAIAELRHRHVDLLVVNGDLTDRGREDDMRRCLALVRSLGVPVLITRGNHDRRLAGACAPDGDCLRAQAFPRQAVGDGPVKSVRRVGRRLAVVGLDSCRPGHRRCPARPGRPARLARPAAHDAAGAGGPLHHRRLPPPDHPRDAPPRPATRSIPCGAARRSWTCWRGTRTSGSSWAATPTATTSVGTPRGGAPSPSWRTARSRSTPPATPCSTSTTTGSCGHSTAP